MLRGTKNIGESDRIGVLLPSGYTAIKAIYEFLE
jgi:hypothetical protein